MISLSSPIDYLPYNGSLYLFDGLSPIPSPTPPPPSLVTITLSNFFYEFICVCLFLKCD